MLANPWMQINTDRAAGTSTVSMEGALSPPLEVQIKHRRVKPGFDNGLNRGFNLLLNRVKQLFNNSLNRV
jgi:hypothetical protein